MKHLQTIIEDVTTAERICACCGMVLDDAIPSERGITIHDNEDKIHWNSTTPSHHDGAMGSIADTKSKDSFKINKWQNRLRISNSEDARVSANLIALKKIFDSKHVPRTIQNTSYHLSRHTTKKLLDIGAGRDSFQKAIIYHAYEISGNKYLRKQFLKDFDITDTKMFNKYSLILKQEFHIVTDYAKVTEKLLLYHAMDLRFSKKETDLALCIINHARKKGLIGGKSPAVIASTALYISHYSTQKYESNTLGDIAKIFNVSVGAIQYLKRQWHEILNVLNLRRNVCKYAKTKYI